MKTCKRNAGLVLALGMLLFCLVGCGKEPKDGTDYSDTGTWAYFNEGENKSADLFLICPTVDMGQDGEYNMSMEDENTKANFLGALSMERGIYEDFAAFVYYFEKCNDGRPLILAGFSQGSQLLLMLMEEYFDDPAYSDRLIAAYCIGWRVTEDDLTKFPHLKMAQGEGDTGVIVSFNTEAEGIVDSLLVPEGVKSLGINPLNWKTDGTPADKSLNEGACFTDYSARIVSEIPELTGAYLDEARGTLIATDIVPADYSNSLFPDGVYHLYDYQFFYRNLQENVRVRTEAFLGAGR